MKEKIRATKLKVRPIRRVLQIGVLSLLIITPYLTSNHLDWSPSRIVLGHLPEPRIFPIAGDLWSMSIGSIRLSHPVAFIEETISAKRIYMSFLISAIIPILITITLGRVFCSWLCPVGFILELNQKVNRFLKKMGIHKTIRITDIRYIVLSIALVLSFFLAFPLISIFDPPHMLGRELMYIFTHNAFSLTGIGILSGILLFEMFLTSRAWCNYLCPSGGALSILGSWRLWRIKMDKERCTHCSICNDVCPYYLEPMRLADDQEFDWIKCDNCGLCRDACPEGAISYTTGRR